MVSINSLSSTSTITGSEQIVVYDVGNADVRKASMSTLLAYLQSSFAAPGFTTVYASPTLSGFNVPIAASTQNVWLVLSPTGAFAAGSITLPILSSAIDGQEILVSSSQAITTLTIIGNGASVSGAPTALGVGGFFSLRFNRQTLTWYTTAQSLGATGSTPTFTSIRDVNGNTILALTPDYTLPGSNTPWLEIEKEDARVRLVAAGPNASYTVSIAGKGDGNVSLSATGTGEVSMNAVAGGFVIDEAEALLAATKITLQSLSQMEINTSSALANFSAGVQAGGGVRPFAGTLTQLNAGVLSAFGGIGVGARGIRATCTDSNAAATGNFGAVVASGGANIVPVYHDGTTWRIG